MRVGGKGVRLKRSSEKGKGDRVLKTKKKARLGIIQNGKLDLQKKGGNVRVGASSSELTISSSDDCPYDPLGLARNNHLRLFVQVRPSGKELSVDLVSNKNHSNEGIEVVVDIGRVEVVRGMTQQFSLSDEFSESELLRAIITIENVRANRESLPADEDLVQDSFNLEEMIQVAMVVEDESARLNTGRRSGRVSEATPIRHSMKTRNLKPRLS
ncbi:hypothetical protein Q3G72_011257 [Acer saccharum]|nr:hypothetical protein Q3G72_011257 [Acer saccharum]